MNEANVRETKDRLLDVAELLFATQGIAATSLRQITSEAKVNLAAVNYHFQSKDELVRSAYTRRLRPMNALRLARLDALELNGENEVIPLDSLLVAFYEPVIDMAHALKNQGVTIGQMLGRIYTEPHAILQTLWMSEMAEVARRYSAAFMTCLPHLRPEEVLWRLHFSIGVLAHTLAADENINRMTQGRINLRDKQEVLRQMTHYAKAGLLAPSLECTT